MPCIRETPIFVSTTISVSRIVQLGSTCLRDLVSGGLFHLFLRAPIAKSLSLMTLMPFTLVQETLLLGTKRSLGWMSKPRCKICHNVVEDSGVVGREVVYLCTCNSVKTNTARAGVPQFPARPPTSFRWTTTLVV